LTKVPAIIGNAKDVTSIRLKYNLTTGGEFLTSRPVLGEAESPEETSNRQTTILDSVKVDEEEA